MERYKLQQQKHKNAQHGKTIDGTLKQKKSTLNVKTLKGVDTGGGGGDDNFKYVGLSYAAFPPRIMHKQFPPLLRENGICYWVSSRC